MSTSTIGKSAKTNLNKPSLTRLAFAIALAGFSMTAQAGKITSMPSASGASGFGGWNLDNVVIELYDLSGSGSTFDESTGAYVFDADSDFSYIANIYDDNVNTTLMGHVEAKPWPVGEPAGIKIVHDDFDVKEGKPTNCIMSTSYLDGHFLDEADPQQVLCSGPFQSHKRYKQPMLPETVNGGNDSIDLVFNVEAEAGSRDYQVFQKINNWTDVRLKGFTIQVGSGTGGNFVPATDATAGVGVTNLSLSVPAAIWPANQLANFSTGLFGPIDPKHDRPEGYFDPDTRAGFNIVEYPNVSGQTDTLTSGSTLGSDYVEVPAGAAVAYQFGNWLPNTMLPFGIFFDDDGNPDTDAELVAWYGYNPAITNFSWMEGSADNFATFPDASVTALGTSLLHTVGVIDDLVNVGLNYVVTVGDVSNFPNSNFTIRITPVKDDSGMAAPTYVGETPAALPEFTISDAEIRLDPSPLFIPGSLLTARVGDADLNTTAGIDTTTVEVTTDNGSVAPYTLTLEELGEDRGVFAANLPAEFSNVALGTVVTVTYIDAAGGTTTNEPIAASSTASASLPAGLLQLDPSQYTVAENGGSVTLTVVRTDGTTGAISVEYNTKSGTAIGNEDFVPDTATLFFADGETSKTVTIQIIDDTAVEGDETFNVLLSGALGGAVLGSNSSALVTITDDETVVSASSDGGGFCSYNANGRFDPVLPAIILAALTYLGWRLKKRAS